jgi:hypothetical protein
MTILRDAHKIVYDVPDEVIDEMAKTQVIVFDEQGREFGFSHDELQKYKLDDQATAQLEEKVLIKVLTSERVHVQAPTQSSRCCYVGDIVIWCNNWA